MRQYNRLIERLDGCKQHGWADLWLAGAGAGAALAVAAFVGIWTLPQAPEPGARNVLLILMTLGALIAAICILAYLSQRRDRGKEINELKRDLQVHAGR